MGRFKVGKQARTKKAKIGAVAARVQKRGGKLRNSTLRALGLADASVFPRGYYQPSEQDRLKAADNYRRILQSCRLNPSQSTPEYPVPSA